MNELAQLNVPGPIYEPLNADFWKGAENGVLKIQHCLDCDSHVFYPRPICPCCWADALTWVRASGKGALKSFSVIHKPGHPGWGPVAPYVVGLIKLAEGPTMLSHVLTGEPPPTIGAEVSFAPTDIGGRVLPCFKLSEEIDQ
ncbi:Zn-ribbon domain-containing OB-fold protein [Litoreibacter albidus]|uniref:Zn-ribbon domain-containing OB-fold protein n=1 Tax=Litoreibacter albidus TaxID=670155 RepID=UPI0037355DCA